MSNQTEDLKIGKQLHDARVAKGYTLDDLQKNTKIQKRYLMAIEEDNFDALPGDFYVRAFVRQYADSVDLDGTELIKQFKKAGPELEVAEDEETENNEVTSRSVPKPVSETQVNLKKYLPFIGVALIIVVIIAGIWMASSKTTKNTSKTEIQTSKVSVDKKDDKPAAKKAAKKSPAKPATDSSKVAFTKTATQGNNLTYKVKGVKDGKVKVKVKSVANQSSWSSISTDGSAVWQGTQANGQSKTVAIDKGTSQVAINLGNAPQTQIYVNNRKLTLAKNSDGTNPLVRVITLVLKGNGKATTSANTNSQATTTTTTQANNNQYGATGNAQQNNANSSYTTQTQGQ